MYILTRSFLSALAVSSALVLPSFSFAQEPKSNTLSLVADDISYDQTGTTVTAKGNVNILSDYGNVWAERIVYNSQTGEVFAEGNVVFETDHDLTIYVERLSLKEEMKAALIENIQIRMGTDEKLGPRLAAKKATREGNVYSLHNAVYSACESCSDNDDDLPWKIRAREISYDTEEGVATYDDAILDVYGTPIFYLPYFKHVLIEKAENGFLAPRFGSSTSKGFEVRTAYYHRFNQHHDTTARLRYMTKRGPMFTGEHRIANKNLNSTIRGSFLDDEHIGTLRSHLETEIKYVVTPGIRYGANINLASDDTFLDDFTDHNPSHLTSIIYAENASKNHYYGTSINFYQDQKVGSVDARTVQALPQFIAERVFRFDHNRTNSLTLSGHSVNLYRDEGTRTQKLNTGISYKDSYFANSGDRFDIEASLRSDVYYVSTDSYSEKGEDGTHYRVQPQVSLTWQKPYTSENQWHTITPKAMLTLSPRGGNPEDIPNEDAVAYELDVSNLFDTNRFAGYDRVESGPRFMYGLENTWGEPDKSQWKIFFGQSLRYFNDSSLPKAGGTENKSSDWVAYAEGKPSDWLSLNANARFDSNTFETQRLDLQMLAGRTSGTFLRLTHSQVEDGPNEFRLDGRYRFNKKYDIEAEIHRDMNDGGRNLNLEGTLNYTHDCYRLSFKARRRGFENRNVPPSTDFLFNIELLTIGRDYE